jgi:hypothetical protein
MMEMLPEMLLLRKWMAGSQSNELMLLMRPLAW